MLDAAITFADLRKWFEDDGIDPLEFPENGATFFPYLAEEGTHYPVEGGMNETIRASGRCPNVRFVTLSGLGTIRLALGDVRPFDVPVFAECLARTGGCINGPASASSRPAFARWMDVEKHAGNLSEGQIGSRRRNALRR